MKSLLDLVPFLTGYPLYVRSTMLALPSIYALVFVILALYAPRPRLIIDALHLVSTSTPNTIAFDVIVRNPTEHSVNITAADIEFYAGEKPNGGLLSSIDVSATYTVERSKREALEVVEGGLPFKEKAKGIRPYSNQPYVMLSIPLAQNVQKDKGDRFIIIVRGDNLVPSRANKAELKLDYDRTKESASVVVSIESRDNANLL